MKKEKIIIHADGASRGNPGPSAIGVTFKDDSGKVIARISENIGITTNNQAEYRAIIAGLEKAASLGARQVVLYSDSELVVNQIKGRYRVKNTGLRPLYQQVVRLLGPLESFTITHVPRSRNAAADSLANQALDNRRD